MSKKTQYHVGEKYRFVDPINEEEPIIEIIGLGGDDNNPIIYYKELYPNSNSEIRQMKAILLFYMDAQKITDDEFINYKFGLNDGIYDKRIE